MPQATVRLDAERRQGSLPGEFACAAIVTNAGDSDIYFNAAQAAHPSLVLEVRDDSGDAVLLSPPSAPGDADLARGEPIAPGESITIDFVGFLDRSLPAGKYVVRYVSLQEATGGSTDDPLTSDWLGFEIVAPRKGFPRAQPLPELRSTTSWLSHWLVRWVRSWWHRIICVILRWLGRSRCDRVHTREVDEQRTETISNAPPGSEAWNGTYGWRARFMLTVDERQCTATVTVRIRVVGTISTAQRNAWEQAIEQAWNGRFKLCCRCCCCADGYRIAFDMQFVSSGEHQVVNAGASTTNMGNWGRNDTVDISHEFGHMLGALEEYFTVNGVDYGAARQPNGNIMNNPANPPEPHHVELVERAAEAELGTDCSTKRLDERC